jgi:TonB family protein
MLFLLVAAAVVDPFSGLTLDLPLDDPRLCVATPMTATREEFCDPKATLAAFEAAPASTLTALWRKPEAIFISVAAPRKLPDEAFSVAFNEAVKGVATVQEINGKSYAGYILRGPYHDVFIGSNPKISLLEDWLATARFDVSKKIHTRPKLKTGKEVPLIPGGLLSQLRGKRGAILVRVRISAAGTVDSAAILRSTIPLLDDLIATHCKQWVFEPTVVDGKPAAVEFLQPFNFIF